MQSLVNETGGGEQLRTQRCSVDGRCIWSVHVQVRRTVAPGGVLSLSLFFFPFLFSISVSLSPDSPFFCLSVSIDRIQHGFRSKRNEKAFPIARCNAVKRLVHEVQATGSCKATQACVRGRC